MKCTYALDKDALYEYSYVLDKLYSKPIKFIYYIFIICFLLLIVSHIDSIKLCITYLLGIILLIFNLKRRPKYVERNVFNENPLPAHPIDYTFNDTYLEANGIQFEYKNIHKLVETDEYIFIFKKKKSAFIIKKDCLENTLQLQNLLMKGSNQSFIDLDN